MRNTALLITIAGATLAAACHSAPPPETAPVEKPTAEIAVVNAPKDDTLEAMTRRADSVERVRLALVAERARADSAEQARLAAEAAEKLTALRAELGVMVHFDVGRAKLLPEDQAALARKVAILTANPAVRLQITGACDDRGSDRYNMALGSRRAATVKSYLVGKGIDVARLDQMSDGENSPIAAGNDEAAWAQNRRAEFRIVGGDVALSMNQ
jgi:peptidoglycan-associated lipoprotein